MCNSVCVRVCVYVCVRLSFVNVGSHSAGEEGALEQREVEGGNSLGWAGRLEYEGPWGLRGTDEDGAVGAHDPQKGYCRGCVRVGVLVMARLLVMDQGAGARTAVEEVWFWDKNLVKAGEVQVEEESGPPWAPLQLQTEVEGAQVEWGAMEVVFPALEVTYSLSPPQCGRLVCAPAGNGRTLRWFPAPRGKDAPRLLTA